MEAVRYLWSFPDMEGAELDEVCDALSSARRSGVLMFILAAVAYTVRSFRLAWAWWEPNMSERRWLFSVQLTQDTFWVVPRCWKFPN